MVTIFLSRNGQTEQVSSIDRGWLNPAQNCLLWVDLFDPSIPELLILSDTFGFHPLSVEDARADLHYLDVSGDLGTARARKASAVGKTSTA